MFVPDRVLDLTFRYSDDSSQLSRGQGCLGLFLEEDPLYLQQVEEGGALQADRLPGHVAPHLGLLRSEVLLHHHHPHHYQHHHHPHHYQHHHHPDQSPKYECGEVVHTKWLLIDITIRVGPQNSSRLIDPSPSPPPTIIIFISPLLIDQR